MTGLPDHNYPAFDEVARTLRATGATVLSPHEIPAQDSWNAYMRASLGLLLQAEVCVLLPGWEQSRGARAELDVARTVGLDVRTWECLSGRD